METRAGVTVTILAAPFRRASLLRCFLEAVRHLRGVETLALVDFRHGMLSLRVTYADAVPLSDKLRGLAGFDLSIEQEGDRISVALADDGDGWE